MTTPSTETPGPRPAIDPLDYRNAMARLAAAVNVVTTDGPAGRGGFAASAVCSVSDNPATLLVCLNRSSSVFGKFVSNQVACINTLAAEHQPLAGLFGGKTPMDERFAGADWVTGDTGSPVLANALVSFDCDILDGKDIGTHRVLYCSVRRLYPGQGGQALTYFQRAYHPLG